MSENGQSRNGTDQLDYSRSIENGFERCVWCGIIFGAEDRDDDIRGEEHPPGIGGGVNHTYGPVRDRAGQQYESVGASDPGSYLMHVGCYLEYHAEVASETNESLYEYAPDGGQPAGGTHQQGIIGTCVDCAGQMVEVWRSLFAGRGNLGLECQDCGETSRIEYIIGEENPWQNPSVQKSVTDTTVKSINWIDCPRCHGHGWVKDPICDLRRVMNGREHPCPNCHTEGTVPRVVETDVGCNGRSVDTGNDQEEKR